MTDRDDDRGTPPLKHPGCLALIVVVLVGLGLVGWSLWRINAAVTTFQERFTQPDWMLVEGPEITREEPLEQRTFVFSGEAHLHGATASIAILGGNAVLDGRYAGDVHFLGRNLDIAPDCVIEGMLDVAAARYITVRGRVEGGISGTWDRIMPSDAASGTHSGSSP